ncbi:MAG: helix-turn-helix transcriptional regulator [Alphaproteobacteria bacterium]|nr:helix-turn-helix transcriptional regulator [Alphaproteobacteria bacterium]
MEKKKVIAALASLAQETRLGIFRLLVTAGPAGLTAGAIAKELSIAPNTLSFHLSHMKAAGLARNRREGREIFYAADYSRAEALLQYLAKNCCKRCA